MEKHEYGTTDDDIKELLTEATTIYKELGSSHRWYDEEFRVVNIDGMLIGYDWFHVTGDNSVSDMGLEFDINSICQVEKKQRTIDYYQPIV